MWFSNQSIACYIFCGLIFIGFCICDWVEIPQFETKKSYIGVTPYDPYIYEQTLFPSTTVPSFETLVEPDNYKKYAEEKKSITKLPDFIIRNKDLTTEPTVFHHNKSKPKHNHTTPVKIITAESIVLPVERLQSNQSKVVKNNKNNPKNRKDPKKNNKSTTTTSTTTHKPSKNQQTKVFNKKNDNFDEYENEFEEEEGEYDDDRNEDLVDDEYYDDTEQDYEGEDGEEYEEGEEGEEYEDDVDVEDEDEYKKETKNGYSYVGFLPYLQKIQSTLIRNSHTNTNSKVSFLADIRDRLLYTIKEKMSNLWSFQSDPPSRKARSTSGDRGDHYESHPSWEKEEKSMDYTSNEGALLTLGFLTFAVFLIKCVLKLIHAFKSKDKTKMQMHMMYYPYTTTTTTTTTAAGRRRRSIEEEDARNAVHISDLIDRYKFK